jgi:hypothetical protein
MDNLIPVKLVQKMLKLKHVVARDVLDASVWMMDELDALGLLDEQLELNADFDWGDSYCHSVVLFTWPSCGVCFTIYPRY